MDLLFSDTFQKSLKKYSSLKSAIRQKVDMIAENPAALGEPLKGALRGYYSFPVRRNFIIIYQYCRACRKKGDDEIVLCHDCNDTKDDTIRFIAFGPHDAAYGKDL
jgi:mRNA-degrading endonuclease YafQ of YafQ-DinJ toxin-antitoxin module